VRGRTLIRSHRFPELLVGDLVRCEEVVKGWYNDTATFETRRDSTLTILKRADTGESELKGHDEEAGDDMVAPEQ
jgi:hypothetical protein